MLPFVLLSGCLINTDLYEQRRAELLAAEGDTDSGCTPVRVWADADGDGFGNPAYGDDRCGDLTGWASNDADCDDADAAVTAGVALHADADGDGFGDAADTDTVCPETAGWVEDATDCDDEDAGVNPGAEEVCGTGVDEDCDADLEECRWEGLVSTDAASAVWLADPGEIAGLGAVGDLTGDGLAELAVVGASAVHLMSAPEPGDWTLGSTDFARLTTPAGSAWARVVNVDLDAGDQHDLVALARGVGGDVAYLVSGPFSGERAIAGTTDHIVLPSTDEPPVLASAGPALWVGFPAQGSILGFDLLSAPTDAADADSEITGSGTDALGYAVAVADLDGDGVDDLQCTAPGASSGLGAVYSFTGPIGTVSPADATFVVEGRTSGDRLGGTASWQPHLDIDGDGHLDLAVSSPEYDGLQDGAGLVLVYRGPLSGTYGVLDAYSTVQGVHEGGGLGSALGAGGDVDLDGRDDLLIGRPASADGGARTYLAYGPLMGGSEESGLSHVFARGSVAADPGPYGIMPGDVNGDGGADVALWGEDDLAAAVWLFAGGAY